MFLLFNWGQIPIIQNQIATAVYIVEIAIPFNI